MSDVSVVAVNPLDLTVPDRARVRWWFAQSSVCLSAVVIGSARYSVASLTRSDRRSVPERIIMSASAHPQAPSC